MKAIIVIIVGLVLVNNIAVAGKPGVHPAFRLSAGAGISAAAGILITLAMAAAAVCAWPLEKYLLPAYGTGYLRMTVFIPLAAGFGYLFSFLMGKLFSPGSRKPGRMRVMMTADCAVAGAIYIYISQDCSYLQSLAAAAGEGAVLILVTILFTAMRYSIDRTETIPGSLRGTPAYFVAAAFLAMILTGFSQAAAVYIL